MLVKEYLCAIYGKNMMLIADKSSIENKIWKCRGKDLKHDSKISMHSNPIHEGIKV